MQRPFADNRIDRHDGSELNILSLLLPPNSEGLNRRVKCKHLNGSLWGSKRIYGRVVKLQPFCQQFSERPDTGKFTPPPLSVPRRIIPEIIPGGKKIRPIFSPFPPFGIFGAVCPLVIDLGRWLWEFFCKAYTFLK